MLQRDQILKRIDYVQAELTALARLVELAAGGAAPAGPAASLTREAATPSAATAEPVAAEPPLRRQRWRYQPGTWYRIVGENPFRNGNNYNLFEYLRSRYGDQPFSREQLSEAIGLLARKGRITTEQAEETFVMVFLRSAGALKDRIRMAAPPAGGAVQPKVPADGELPPEPGQVQWRLQGSPAFREGSINTTLWNALQGGTFSRDELSERVQRMVETGELETTRPPAVVARDFLGLVVDRGLATRA